MKLKIIILMLFVTFKVSAQTDTTSFAYSKPLFDFDESKMLFQAQATADQNPVDLSSFYALTSYREGVKPTEGIFELYFKVAYDPKSGMNRFYIYNRSVEEMISIGLKRKRSQYFFWEVKDPTKYRYSGSDADKTTWLRKNGYCYEQLYQDGTLSQDLFENCSVNIGYMLGLNVRKEIRKVKSLVLIRTSTVDKIKTRGGERTDDMNKLVNEPIYRIGEYLDNSGSTLPFKDETGYNEMIDLNLSGAKWSDVPSIRKALQAYDLDLVEREAEVEMCVVSEIKKYNQGN